MELQRPPSRSASEMLPQMPPKRVPRSSRGAPRSSRGTGGSMRSLSPALQVMQRSLFTPAPDGPRAPDAPRGERPREYLAALSGVADLLEYASSASPNRKNGPEDLPPGTSSLWRVATPSEDQKTQPSLATPSFGTRSRRPSSPFEDIKDQHRAPVSARTVRHSSDLAVAARPAPQSARPSRQRSSSAGRRRNWDQRPGLSCAGFEDAACQDMKRLPGITSSRPQSARDADMDALDGLLASLADEVRNKQTDMQTDLPSPPKAKLRVKSESAPQQKCGSFSKSRRQASRRKSNMFAYDEEMVACSPPLLPEAEESQASTSIYCPLSPTLMSVHLPGSPVPQAPELDDTASSVVLLGDLPKPDTNHVRPSRVRVECRRIADDEKHVPEAPRRRLCGTGKVTSRPLGCTLVANLGGA